MAPRSPWAARWDWLGCCLRPGSLLIEPVARGATFVGRVQVLAANAALTHTMALLSALGFLLLLFGFLALRRVVSAVPGFGLLLLAFAVILFAASGGMNHIIAHIINHGGEDRSLRTLLTTAVNVQAVKAGIVIIGGYGYLLGFACIALALSRVFPSGLHKMLALLVLLICLVALVLLLIGDHFHNLTTFYAVAERAVIPLNLWAIVLGVAMYQGHPSLTPAQSD